MFAFDTNVLVWGIRQEPDPKRPDMVQQCIDLLQDCKNRRIPMMVPSVVVAEYLIGYGKQDQERQREILSRHFYVAPFDAKCAAIAAELYEKLEFDKVKNDFKIGRQCLKVDYKVVATAIGHNATVIYTDDEHFRAIGKDKILVKPIPDLGYFDQLSKEKPMPKPPDQQGSLGFGLDDDPPDDDDEGESGSES